MIKLLIIEDSEETVDLIRLILSNESDIKIFDTNSIKDSINLIKKDKACPRPTSSTSLSHNLFTYSQHRCCYEQS